MHQPRLYLQRSAFHVAGQISTALELNGTPFGPTPASDRDVPAVEMRGKEVGGGSKVGECVGWNNWRLNTPDKKVWIKRLMLVFGRKES